MATQVQISQFLVSLQGLVSGTAGIGTRQLNLGVTAASLALTNGTGLNKVNQLYQTQGTLAASATVDVDLYAYGAVNDDAGNAFTMLTVKLLIFLNLGVVGTPVEADYIKLGGKGTTAGWTSFFGTNTDTGKVSTGGMFALSDPGATGYVVGNSTTNHILTLTAGANTGTCTYQLIVVGATA